jgi:hypothetical protein
MRDHLRLVEPESNAADQRGDTEVLAELLVSLRRADAGLSDESAWRAPIRRMASYLGAALRAPARGES